MKTTSSRRTAIRQIFGSTAFLGLAGSIVNRVNASGMVPEGITKGRINHSVSRWCYNSIPLEEFCQACRDIGIQSIELVGKDEWPVLKKYGLTCAMGNGADLGIAKGWNDPGLHNELIERYEALIPVAAKAGIPSIIALSGNRNGMDDEQGMINCAQGIRRIMPLAEKQKVNIVIELLNSKIDHKDYMCDRTTWGAALVEMVGSERFGLLYDIYHMQIMEGDVIRTIRDYQKYIMHYHTGGVPGRNEIDETQELYYPAIMKAIAETGFTGFVGQEYVPTWEDKIASLKKCIGICDV